MWSQNERKDFAKFLAVTAKLYGANLDFDVCQMVLEDILDLPYLACMQAVVKFRRDPKNKTWPRAADIRALVNPEMDSDTKGKLAAARVVESVSKFGYNNPEDAKVYIGELGWRAVQRFGGWQFICENLGVTLQLSTFQAQLRDIAIATDKAAQMGMADSPIGLSAPKGMDRIESNQLQKLDFTKLLTQTKEKE